MVVASLQLCYSTLRDRIASGDLAGGTWLREAGLASELGASRTPVREALRLLASEGLVELVPNRGARVVSFSGDDLDETYQLRALLEGHGAGLAARRATADDLAAITAAEDAYEAALRDEAAALTAATCNLAFHAAVLRAARSPRLATMVGTLWSTPQVTQAIGHYREADRQRSQLQHRDIVTAIGHGDDALAASAMRSHILAARYTVVEHTVVEHTVVEHTVVEHPVVEHTVVEHTVAEGTRIESTASR